MEQNLNLHYGDVYEHGYIPPTPLGVCTLVCEPACSSTGNLS